MESNLQERTSAAPLEPMDDMMACSSRPLLERSLKPQPEQALKCPRCDSTNTKFCYYNNYSLSQPRYFCKNCRRYWTKGGSLRNVPVGGGCRKNKRSKRSIMDQTDPVDRRETSTSVSARANTIINHNNNPKELTNTCCSPLIDQTCDILNPGFASSVYSFGNDDINLAFARIQQAASRVGSSEHRHQPALTNCNSASEYLGIAVASGQSALMAGLSPMSSLSALNSLHSFKSSAFNSRALDFNNPRSLTRNTTHDIHDSSTPAAHVHGDLDMNSFIETHPHPQISEAATGIHNFNAPPFSLSMDIHGINDIDIPDAVNQWTMMYQKLPIEYPPLDQHGQELSGGHILTPMDQKPKALDTAKGSSAEDRSPRLTSPEWKQQNVSSDQTIFETEGKDAIYWNINAGAWPDLSATNYGSSSHQQQQR